MLRKKTKKKLFVQTTVQFEIQTDALIEIDAKFYNTPLKTECNLFIISNVIDVRYNGHLIKIAFHHADKIFVVFDKTHN